MKRIFIISLILLVGAILLIFPLIRDEKGSIEEDKKAIGEARWRVDPVRNKI